MYSR